MAKNISPLIISFLEHNILKAFYVLLFITLSSFEIKDPKVEKEKQFHE